MLDNRYLPYIFIGSIAFSNIAYKSFTLREEIVLFKNKINIPYCNQHNLFGCILIPSKQLETYNKNKFVLANSIFVKNDNELLYRKIDTNKHYKIKYWGIEKTEYGLFKKIYHIEDISREKQNRPGNYVGFLKSNEEYVLTPMNSYDIFN